MFSQLVSLLVKQHLAKQPPSLTDEEDTVILGDTFFGHLGQSGIEFDPLPAVKGSKAPESDGRRDPACAEIKCLYLGKS